MCEGTAEEGQEVLSLDGALLPSLNIDVSIALSIAPGVGVVNFGTLHDLNDVWCAPASPLPTVTLTFTQPVVITALLTGGSDLSGDYVSNFTVQYSADKEPLVRPQTLSHQRALLPQ